MSDDNLDPTKNTSSWPHSEVYNRTPVTEHRGPRTSAFKFGTFRDFLNSVGKYIIQSLISFFLIAILSIFLFLSPEEWGGDQAYLVVAELIKLATYTISVFLVIKIFDDAEIDEIGL